jgi:hypothetical protein
MHVRNIVVELWIRVVDLWIRVNKVILFYVRIYWQTLVLT